MYVLKKLIEEKNGNANTMLGGQHPLYFACSNFNKEMVEYLIKNGANVNIYEPIFYGTPLMYLCSLAKKDILNNYKPNKIETAIEIMKILLNNGADPDIKNSSDETALYIAGSFVNISYIKILLPITKDIIADNYIKIKYKNKDDFDADQIKIKNIFEEERLLRV
jgi:ankyrin repeat protein